MTSAAPIDDIGTSGGAVVKPKHGGVVLVLGMAYVTADYAHEAASTARANTSNAMVRDRARLIALSTLLRSSVPLPPPLAPSPPLDDRKEGKKDRNVTPNVTPEKRFRVVSMNDEQSSTICEPLSHYQGSFSSRAVRGLLELLMTKAQSVASSDVNSSMTTTTPSVAARLGRPATSSETKETKHYGDVQVDVAVHPLASIMSDYIRFPGEYMTERSYGPFIKSMLPELHRVGLINEHTRIYLPNLPPLFDALRKLQHQLSLTRRPKCVSSVPTRVSITPITASQYPLYVATDTVRTEDLGAFTNMGELRQLDKDHPFLLVEFLLQVSPSSSPPPPPHSQCTTKGKKRVGTVVEKSADVVVPKATKRQCI